ncbi:uncharacterized protein LOC107486737 [Arachis duranensis]|uniref:Uncharacterized protein LOC107486737 n=1 Tax=Arachis duranensis TaxID=130453 RepID=A0A6P4DCF7_ARADU|nr:uncharacterized protein LOC107486737 [Arachis duranensis]
MVSSKQMASFVISVFVFCLLASSFSSKALNFKLSTKEQQNWINHGGDIYNRRYANKEHKINLETVSNLTLKWKFYTGKDITATPSIFDGTLYFPSWKGEIFAVRACDGSLVWKQNLQELTGLTPTGLVAGVNNLTVSRATPTIADEFVIVGIYGPAVVIALKRLTGELVWQTRLDSHDSSVLTMSGTYYKRAFYVGTSSLEEGSSPEQCCTFRGSFSKLDIHTGAILWQTYMLPDNHGKLGEYAGAAVWGSSPSIDEARNHVYIATGNLYSAPLRVRRCQEKQNNLTTRPTHPDECVEEENHSNSILALDLDNGEMKWYHQLGGYDVWFLACNNVSSSPNCPPGPNPDADFSEAPMMITIDVKGRKEDIVVAVQKSGFAWALHRDNGNIVWSTEAGPGGIAGGGYWGAATDTKMIYTNIANSDAKNFTLKPSNKTTTSGGWVAMDASSGTILWSVGNPSNASASGPVSVANDIVFAGSPDWKGSIYAINAKSGEIVWSFETGATVYGGMSISDGCIYLGNGYNVSLGLFFGNHTSGTSLYAFCV